MKRVSSASERGLWQDPSWCSHSFRGDLGPPGRAGWRGPWHLQLLKASPFHRERQVNQSSSGGGQGSSGDGVGIRGVAGCASPWAPWRAVSPPHPWKNSLSWGAVVKHEDMRSEAKQVLSPLSLLFDH